MSQATINAANQATETTTSTEIDRVTKAFIKEVEEKGIVHVFEWMSGWFDRVGMAVVEDHLKSYLGEMARDKNAQNLQLLEEMSRMAESVSNQSNLESANMMRRARLAAMAKIFNRNYNAFGGRNSRESAWEPIVAARDAKRQAADAAESAKG